MGDKSELENSIQQYQTQLQQVESALEGTQDPAEKQTLQSLINDLKELINLTLQTLNSSEGMGYEEKSCSSRSSLEDEMALFMSEIKTLDATASAAENCENDEAFAKKLQAMKDELQAMVGKKCSAPHNHSWGTKSYHNAIICGIDDSRDYNLADIKQFKLRILFTNPTHREMLPCSYFLEGECRFDASKCKFSHGELVPFGELKEYQEPDFTQLKRNCVVLAKLPDRIWHKGRVLCANFVDKSCRVKLDFQKKEVDCEFEDLFPIFHDDDLSSGSSDSDSEDSSDYQEARKAHLIQQSLFTPAPDRALGEWEKHTKGIGSKLMQRMGYIVGTGLGSSGEGIIVPISAQILPPGRSLDHCMELREAANGDKDLFSVERKLQREQKKQEALNVKAYERESNKTDIFSFLNDNILTNDSNITKPNAGQKQDFKNHSTKNLNVESVKIADDIKKKQREILKVKEAMKRHSSGSDMHKRLQGQLAFKTNELNSLKKSETILAREQLSRRHKDKISVF